MIASFTFFTVVFFEEGYHWSFGIDIIVISSRDQSIFPRSLTERVLKNGCPRQRTVTEHHSKNPHCSRLSAHFETSHTAKKPRRLKNIISHIQTAVVSEPPGTRSSTGRSTLRERRLNFGIQVPLVYVLSYPRETYGSAKPILHIPTPHLTMLSASLRTAVLAFALASTTTATTVSLASFIPRIDNLPSSCDTVYTTSISGCVPDDFKVGATCTAACVRGLSEIADSVKDKCKNVDAGELSIIGVFQNGLGIQSLCPGITITTISSEGGKTSTKESSTATSTEAVLTTSTDSATEATPTSSSSATGTGDDEPSSSESATGGLTLDPNATGTLATMTIVIPPTSAPADPTEAPNAQLSNADSGGGSPFDVVANGSSPKETFGSAAAALLATTLFFVACA